MIKNNSLLKKLLKEKEREKQEASSQQTILVGLGASHLHQDTPALPQALPGPHRASSDDDEHGDTCYVVTIQVPELFIQ